MSAQDAAACEAAKVVSAAVRSVGGLAAEVARIKEWATEIAAVLQSGGVLLSAGNGGSATHAAHLVGELVGRFRQERPGVKALNLTADGSLLSAVGNDYGFDQVFARQVSALASAGDIVVLFSTSGCSPDIVEAARAAHRVGARVLALTGSRPSPLAAVADDVLASIGSDTAAIQDSHHVAVHALCAELDALVTPTPALSASGQEVGA